MAARQLLSETILSPGTSRRHFLTTVAAGAAVASLPNRSFGATEEVRFGLLGCGGRGGELTGSLTKVKNARLVAVADPDTSRAESMGAKHKAQSFADLRHVLDNPNIDAVIIATCNHWHCLAAIWAIEAGKDVYVEKPLSHSQWEGKQVVLAAQKANRIVQLGTQQRSDSLQQQAREFLHQDKALGKIQYVQANRLGPRGPIGRRDTPLEIPASIDYNLWLGPAEEKPIFRNQLQYDWHWDWNTGSGEMGNWGVHVLDDVRNVAYQDQVSTPSRIVTGGGRVAWNDAGESPNVHFALFETETFPTLIALSNLPDTPDGKKAWNVKAGKPMSGPGSGYVVVCEGGYYFGQRGSGEAVDRDGKSIRKFKGDGDTVKAHLQNFVDAVRSRDASTLNAPVANGHHSTGWCNLANVGFRAARDWNRSQLQDATKLSAWSHLIEDMLGPLKEFGVNESELRSSQVLTHDPVKESFVGEYAAEGNRFLKRDYRAGFEIKSYG
jgi:predicted dehydrogenase